MIPGQELFLHYGYDPNNCPAWYRAAVDSFLGDNPHLDIWQVVDPNRLVSNDFSYIRRAFISHSKSSQVRIQFTINNPDCSIVVNLLLLIFLEAKREFML